MVINKIVVDVIKIAGIARVTIPAKDTTSAIDKAKVMLRYLDFKPPDKSSNTLYMVVKEQPEGED